MKTMLLKNRIEHLENVLSEINHSKLYEYPHVDFILAKEINGKYYYTAGVSDKTEPSKAYLFRPKARARSIPLQNIRYDKQKYRELFDECVEGYVLQQLNKGYKIVYISIAFHIAVWEFINTYYDNIEYFSDGTIDYLEFCHETGISSTLLSHYSGALFPDFVHELLGKFTLESSKKLIKSMIEVNNHMIDIYQIRNELGYKILDRGLKNEERS